MWHFIFKEWKNSMGTERFPEFWYYSCSLLHRNPNASHRSEEVRQETVTDQEDIPTLAMREEEQSKRVPHIPGFPGANSHVELCSSLCVEHHGVGCARAAGQETSHILGQWSGWWCSGICDYLIAISSKWNKEANSRQNGSLKPLTEYAAQILQPKMMGRPATWQKREIGTV